MVVQRVRTTPREPDGREASQCPRSSALSRLPYVAVILRLVTVVDGPARGADIRKPTPETFVLRVVSPSQVMRRAPLW